MDNRISALLVSVVVLGMQLLLVPAYRSTDFEVHRNWLAITYSLPISKWYYEDTSEWTLDYPPLFAWFEWLLAQVAQFVDPAMLQVSNLDYASPGTVLFQRLSVSATGMVLAAAAARAARRVRGAGTGGWGPDVVLLVLVIGNAGLLIVDNIHFQYNGVLLGILLWSILALEEGRDVLAGVLFAVLLNMKHLFAYAAPLYFVQLLRGYCMGASDEGADAGCEGGSAASGPPPAHSAAGRKLQPGSGRARRVAGGGAGVATFAARLALLGSAVALVCAASLGPFIAMGQLPQLLRRLFPFGRGLCHAYWGANFWALYSAADKVAAAGLAAAGLIPKPSAANMAGGLVGMSRFSVLPQVAPAATMAAVLLALAPCLAATWRAPRRSAFASAVAYSCLCGFMFGWHVHEKALLMATLPLAMPAVRGGRDAARFVVLSTAAHVGMFPLLFEPSELPIRWLLALLYAQLAWAGLAALHASPSHGGSGEWPLPAVLKAYVWGFVPVELYCSLGHAALLGGRLPFLPLMLTSLYCAVGVTAVWADMAWGYVREAVGSGGGAGARGRKAKQR